MHRFEEEIGQALKKKKKKKEKGACSLAIGCRIKWTNYKVGYTWEFENKLHRTSSLFSTIKSVEHSHTRYSFYKAKIRAERYARDRFYITCTKDIALEISRWTRNVTLKVIAQRSWICTKAEAGDRISFREWQSYRNKYTGNGSAVIRRKGRRK